MSPPGPMYEALASALRKSEPVALVSVIEVAEDAGDQMGRLRPTLGAKLVVRPGADPGAAEVVGSAGEAELDRILVRDSLAALEHGATVTRHYGLTGEARRDEVTVLIQSFAPPPNLVIFGAVDFTAALAEAGKLLGFRVTVCDARPVFATKRRLPAADEVVVDWPDRYLASAGPDLGPRDAICVLTHDTKFDVPAIIGALRTRAGYIGAMGSRRTHEERWRRLLEAGADEEELGRRLMSPIGLDIGARTPEETAVAICAEIISARAGASRPLPLREVSGPIHRR